MQRSEKRILTSHTGSLTRPDDLVELLFRNDAGTLDRRDLLDSRVCEVVREVVQTQVQHGVDVINDGEVGKVGYATYIKDRLSGFGGTGNTFVYQDLTEFPNLARRVFGDPGRSRRKTPACNAAIGALQAGVFRRERPGSPKTRFARFGNAVRS